MLKEWPLLNQEQIANTVTSNNWYILNVLVILPKSLFSAEMLGLWLMSHSLVVAGTTTTHGVHWIKGGNWSPKSFNAKPNGFARIARSWVAGHSQCLGWGHFPSPGICKFCVEIAHKAKQQSLALTLTWILVRVRYSEIESNKLSTSKAI